jgi:hypothetical protein
VLDGTSRSKIFRMICTIETDANTDDPTARRTSLTICGPETPRPAIAAAAGEGVDGQTASRYRSVRPASCMMPVPRMRSPCAAMYAGA